MPDCSGLRDIRNEATYHEPDMIEATGLHCATVLTVGSRFSHEFSPGTEQSLVLQQHIRSWIPSDLEAAVYPTGETMLDAYARTPLQNCFNDCLPSIAAPTLKDWKSSAEFKALFEKDTISTIELSTFFGHKVLTYCPGRQFITTNEGYIGLAPGWRFTRYAHQA